MANIKKELFGHVYDTKKARNIGIYRDVHPDGTETECQIYVKEDGEMFEAMTFLKSGKTLVTLYDCFDEIPESLGFAIRYGNPKAEIIGQNIERFDKHVLLRYLINDKKGQFDEFSFLFEYVGGYIDFALVNDSVLHFTEVDLHRRRVHWCL